MAAPVPVQVVRYMVQLNRYNAAVRKEVDNLIAKLFREVNSRLLGELPNLSAAQRGRLLALHAQTEQWLRQGYANIGDLVDGRLFSLAKVQSQFAEKLVSDMAKFAGGTSINTVAVTSERLRNIIQLPVEGVPLEDWWQKQAVDAAFRIRQQIQLGLVSGETTPQIVQRLVGKAGVEGVSSRLANGVVRTSVTAVSSNTHYEVFKNQGDDVTNEYEYVATLDDRTTPLCQSLDGNRYSYDDDTAPRPPMHWNCRSTIIPVLNWKSLGISEPDVQLMRATPDGPKPYNSYEEWLRDQSTDTQDTALGVAKAKLWRARKVTLRDLVTADGDPITLDELAHSLDL